MSLVLNIRKTEIDGKYLFLAVVVLLSATVSLTPWWGLPVVAAILRLLFSVPVRWMTVLTFLSTAFVCFIRDVQNDFGPSRVFSKLFMLETLGFPVGSQSGQIITYAIVGLVGASLAMMAATAVKMFQSLNQSRIAQ